ncbi:substrate-binding domain-containing protein [Pseudodonghicola flavimaris]|uniref:Substrate-binding domain-containing protein n=1 Tax=Pseudodonghicola flavimaris TaxID=3050036 RepID=A0ABT7F1S0_9RHOB|nr:substrate-binding domain-containing protein [Pseudodonghicola flavimaris]MDK3018537.1 substrate-binding domain-containing protein [Pseudodonghicola flavimaris]
MKIGLMLSHSGPTGLWTPSSEGSAIVAVEEINATGGVLGAELSLVTVDAGSTPQEAFAASRRLTFDHNVDAIVGLQASYMRPAVRDGACGLAPYIYTPQYEGGFTGPGTAALGITDWEVLAPGISWLAEAKRAQRFFFLGNDYIWPKIAFGTAQTAIRNAGGVHVGEALLPLGERDYQPVFDKIRAARPDVVICALLGEDAVCFNRAFGERGLARDMLRLTLAFEETQLYGVAPENAENLFAVQTFFVEGKTSHRAPMLDAYANRFGQSRPPVTVHSMGLYDGVHLAAALARKAKRVDGHLMARMLDRKFSRPAIYNILGQPELAPEPRLHIAEADGTVFEVRQTV